MACYMIPNQRTASILKLRTLRLRISRANLTIRNMTYNHIIAGEGTLSSKFFSRLRTSSWCGGATQSVRPKLYYANKQIEADLEGNRETNWPQRSSTRPFPQIPSTLVLGTAGSGNSSHEQSLPVEVRVQRRRRLVRNTGKV